MESIGKDEMNLLEYCVFSFGLIVVSFIDLDHMILPDVFTLGGILVGLVGAGLNPERDFVSAFWGFLIGGGFLFAISYLYFVFRKVEGMGGGDIKLLGWIGAMLGWLSLPFVIILSSFAGTIVGSLYLMKTKKGMQTGIPFGPFLSLGALLFMLLDRDWILSLLFPAFRNL